MTNDEIPNDQQSAEKRSRPWITLRDQGSLLALAASLVVLMACYWLYRGGQRGELIQIDRASPLQARFQVDINRADCSEWTSLQFLEPLVFQASDLSALLFDDRVSPAADSAEQLLLSTLARGPRHYRDVLAEGAKIGLSRSTMYRARQRLSVRAASGFWSLASDRNV